MLNPHSKKQSKATASSLDKSTMVETDEQIYCRLCKTKYLINGYREHISVHRRKQRPLIGTYYEAQSYASRQNNADGQSLYIANEGPQPQLKASFFAALAQSRAMRSQNINKESGTLSTQANQHQTSIGFAKFHSSSLKQSITFSEKLSNSSQNPQRKMGSIVDLLASRRICDSPTTPSTSHHRRSTSVYENIMENLSALTNKEMQYLSGK